MAGAAVPNDTDLPPLPKGYTLAKSDSGLPPLPKGYSLGAPMPKMNGIPDVTAQPSAEPILIPKQAQPQMAQDAPVWNPNSAENKQSIQRFVTNQNTPNAEKAGKDNLKQIFPNIDKRIPAGSASYTPYSIVGAFNSKLGDITEAMDNIMKLVPNPGGHAATAALTDFLKQGEKENPLPDDIPGQIIGGVAKTIPTMLGAYATGGGSLEGEAAGLTGQYLTKADILRNALSTAANPITKYMAGENALLKAGDEAKRTGQLLPTLLGAVKGYGEGAKQGILLTGSMGAGDALGGELFGLAKKLGVTNSDGVITEQALKSIIGTPVSFATSSVAEDLANGEPVDWKKAGIQGLSALPYEAPHLLGSVAKGAELETKKAAINKAVDAVGANKVMNFLTATPEDIAKSIAMPESADELQVKSLGKGVEAQKASTYEDKNTAHMEQLALQQHADVKGVVDNILQDKAGFVKSIEASDLHPDDKAALLKKVDEVSKQYNPIEIKKSEFGNKIGDIDQQAAAIQPSTDPVIQAENEVKAEQLKADREAVHNELKQVITDNALPHEKIADLAGRIAKGEKITSPEDLQLQANYPKEVESELGKIKDTAPDITVKEVSPETTSEKGRGSEKGVEGEVRRYNELANEHLKDGLFKKDFDELSELSRKLDKPTGREISDYGYLKRFENQKGINGGDYLSQAEKARLKELEPIIKNGLSEQPQNDTPTSIAQNTGGEVARVNEQTIVNETKPEKIKESPEPTKGLGVNGTDTVPTTINKSTTDHAKALADKIRALKTDKAKLHGGLGGIAAATYDGALETAATVIENGGKLVDAIKSAVDHIKKAHPELDEKDVRKRVEEDLGGLEEEETRIGTKKAISDALREDLGIPPIELPKGLSKQDGLERGKEIVDSGELHPLDIIDKALVAKSDPNKVSFSTDEELAMHYYERQLAAQRAELTKLKVELEGDKSPEAQADLASVTQKILTNLDAEERRLNASQIMGNSTSKSFSARQLETNEQGLVMNSIARIKTVYGDEMPPEVSAELKTLQAKYETLLARNEALEKKIADRAAQVSVPKKRTIFGTKRLSDVEFTKRSADIVEQMKIDLKKSLGQLNSAVPGSPQLTAIAPHVGKLVRLLADRGITKLDDVISHVHDLVKDAVEGINKDDIRDIMAGRYAKAKPLSELNKQIADLKTQARDQMKIDEMERGVVQLTRKKGESSPEVQALQKKIAELKKTLPNEYVGMSVENIKSEIRALHSKIGKGEYLKTPTVKRQFENDPEWVKVNKEKLNLRTRLRKLEQDALNSKKSKFMRGLDWTNRWGRRVIFFGANAVYTKLAGSAVLGSFIHRLPEQGVGVVAAKAFPHLAAGAPIEGNMNAKAEAAWYARIFNAKQTAKNTWSIIKSGETDLSRELSTRPHDNHIPVIDLLAADGHMIIKDPIKEATFNASLINHLNWYADNGIDGTHPLLLEAARQAAYKRAEYEIYQNSPEKANFIKKAVNELEKSAMDNIQSNSSRDKAKGNAQYFGTFLYNFMIPINTVPNNMIGRTLLAWKLPYNLYKAMDVNGELRKGVDKLTANEKDLLLLHIKKGSVGAFYWTLGFALGGSAAGGLYSKFYSDKDREKVQNGGGLDPESNYLRIGGSVAPKGLQHYYQVQALQQGATYRMVHDHFVDDKGASVIDAGLRGAYATAGAIADEIPTVSAIKGVHEAITSPQGYEKFQKDLKRRVGINKATDLMKLMGYSDGE